MPIIISQSGHNATKVDKSEFEKEDYLQNYIHQNPESIPVYEIEEDKRLFVVAREFSTESGPIDALAVDQSGDIYIVETKLYKNPDKRTVVAQALDYGASLWKHVNDFGDFLKLLDKETQSQFQLSFFEKTKAFFNLDDEQANLMLDAMKRNLKDGSLKFVILMDSMDERLRDLIIYVNQNSQFDIFAVEMEYYKFKDYEIMIPKMFGVEVKKNIAGNSISSPRQKWDEKLFFESLNKQLDPKFHQAVKKLYDFSKSNADIKWGTGTNKGSFNPIFSQISPRSVYTAYTDGKLSINFGWLNGDDKATKFRDTLKDKLETETNLKFPDNYREHFVTFTVDEWADQVDLLISVIKDLKDK